MFQRLFAWMKTYERHLSALAMVAGFIADNLLFDRIDLWQTQAVFAAYTLTCFISIPLLHWLESRSAGVLPKWSIILPLTTQFALGGFWSGFVIFYGRSADLGSSWPFLVFLVLVLIGSEYFNQYHARLVFTSVLFFFALYSYAIFAVPIYTGTIGTGTFLFSTAVAIGVFALFTRILRALARERLLVAVFHIRVGSFFVLALMLISYFTNILPPLPLSAGAAGIYHNVSHVPGNYFAIAEIEPWHVLYLGFTPTLHVVPGESLYSYGSVFAPTALMTTIVHRWQWYDPIRKTWVEKARVAYPIIGGRDGGYRGYSSVPITTPGEWRVSIETIDGRRVVRLPFIVELVATRPALETITLK